MSATLASAPDTIPNARGFHGLRTPTYDDVLDILEGPDPALYFYNVARDEWVRMRITHINPPATWGIEHADLWLSIPREKNGRRRDERYCHVWYDCGSKGADQLQDVRVLK